MLGISFRNSQRKKTQVFYDGGCGPCGKLAKLGDKIEVGDRLDFSPNWSEKADEMLDGMELSERMKSLRVIDPKGKLYSGSEAVLVAAQSTIFAPVAWLLRAIPGHKRVLEPMYQWVADHRPSACAVPNRAS